MNGSHGVKIRRCKRCHTPYEGLEVEAFFRRTSSTHRSMRMAVCIGCELTARTRRKQENRPLEKARRTLHHHADKYVLAGSATSRDDFARRYGWKLEQMAHDIEHAMGNGCPYCWQAFAEMEHGLADCTLDIVNPGQLPYYRTNIRWCCKTCNTEKARTPPDLWGAKLQAWERWRQWTANPYPPDSLFGDWSESA